jgi:hypothetical protein
MEKLPESYRTFFFNAMKAFPEIKFLWKWSEEFPKEIPPNLHLSKWFEQQDVLGERTMMSFHFVVGYYLASYKNMKLRSFGYSGIRNAGWKAKLTGSPIPFRSNDYNPCFGWYEILHKINRNCPHEFIYV